MKHLHNQNGAALVIVLAIITIMMIFIPLLLYQLNTANVQFNKTEEQVQADNVAEMGVIYFQKYVQNEINDGNSLLDIEVPNDLPDMGYDISIDVQEETLLTFNSSATIGATTSTLRNNTITMIEE